MEFSQKYPRFNGVIWKFKPLLLSQAEILAKWDSFAELPLLSRAVILAQKDSFDDVTWNFELVLFPRADIFANLRQFSMMLT